MTSPSPTLCRYAFSDIEDEPTTPGSEVEPVHLSTSTGQKSGQDIDTDLIVAHLIEFKNQSNQFKLDHLKECREMSSQAAKDLNNLKDNLKVLHHFMAKETNSIRENFRKLEDNVTTRVSKSVYENLKLHFSSILPEKAQGAAQVSTQRNTPAPTLSGMSGVAEEEGVYEVQSTPQNQQFTTQASIFHQNSPLITLSGRGEWRRSSIFRQYTDKSNETLEKESLSLIYQIGARAAAQDTPVQFITLQQVLNAINSLDSHVKKSYFKRTQLKCHSPDSRTIFTFPEDFFKTEQKKFHLRFIEQATEAFLACHKRKPNPAKRQKTGKEGLTKHGHAGGCKFPMWPSLLM